MTGRPVHLKAETLQRTGSFKIRGAVNKIGSLSEAERKAGVVAASAGNHGQAVAWAAREAGIEATIFMPAETPMAKVEPTRNYGARAELTGTTFEDAVAAAVAHVEETGATFIHPFEDPRRDRRPGDDRPRARRPAARAGDGRRSHRRRRARVRDRAHAARAPAGRTDRRRAGGRVRTARRGHAVRLHDRRGHRGQASGRVHVEPPRGPARVDRDRQRRGDQPGDRAPHRANEARRRGSRRRCVAALLAGRVRATNRRSRSSPAATSTRRC